MRFPRDLKSGEERIKVGKVPVLVMVVQTGVNPLLQCPFLVDRIRGELSDHLLPPGDLLCLDPEVPTPFAQVGEDLLRDRDIHCRVNARERDLAAIGKLGPVLRGD